MYLVDGGFGAWDNWTECTVSCGGGNKTRGRRCDNPAPQSAGKDCDGDLTATKPCNEDLCASKQK